MDQNLRLETSARPTHIPRSLIKQPGSSVKQFSNYPKPGVRAPQESRSRSVCENAKRTHRGSSRAPFVTRLFHGPLSRITAQVCAGAFFFHGNTGRGPSMTQAFVAPRSLAFLCVAYVFLCAAVHVYAFGARTELIIGTWKGSAAGSLGGEADARPRARPLLLLRRSSSHSRLDFHRSSPGRFNRSDFYRYIVPSWRLSFGPLKTRGTVD